ncbi:hypothetical protein GA830_08405 [Mesorhizobium sp. NBSH29]|uniref:hypothetical protein n=1 Tax=Mesorhizobium sp. NBSH29 TaxID=2654249 RepID=UPI001896A3ED|nr:hypothetical protein [Mesorhizobium sp. NBSH29]QPC86754.1 hypothetical protein GA830_08405 [Mesorhizobium sp. NBSH29]
MRNATIPIPAALITACLMLGAAQAQEVDRYTMEKSATGFVRMDRKTGAMSICEERAGQLVCKVAADERTALNDEIERLLDRLTALETRVAAMEKTAPDALPSEESFEKSLSYMEKFFRRFMGIVKDLDQDWRKIEPEALPQKT